jgi:hypothetical protein
MTDARITPVRSIDEHVHVVHKKWELMERAAKTATDARLNVALELRALKQRIEEGDAGDQAALDWWDWYGDHFVRSRSDAEKLLAIAGSSDPPAALQRVREQSQQRKVAFRERLKVVEGDALRSGTQPSPPPASPAESKMLTPTRTVEEPKITDGERQSIEQIADLFKSLSWTGRKEAIRRINRLYQEWHS